MTITQLLEPSAETKGQPDHEAEEAGREAANEALRIVLLDEVEESLEEFMTARLA